MSRPYAFVGGDRKLQTYVGVVYALQHISQQTELCLMSILTDLDVFYGNVLILAIMPEASV